MYGRKVVILLPLNVGVREREGGWGEDGTKAIHHFTLIPEVLDQLTELSFKPYALFQHQAECSHSAPPPQQGQSEPSESRK